MNEQVDISISGLGIIFYSPSSVSHIALGEDYLQSHFWKPEDVAKHVMDCQMSAFCTGGPGDYRLRVFDGAYPDEELEHAEAMLRLGIQVKDGVLHFDDLYALMAWDPQYSQKIALDDGFYRITVYWVKAPSVSEGPQVISMYFERWEEKPALNYAGVPSLA